MVDENVFNQHGDEPDAANFAQATGVAAKTSYTLQGFEITYDSNNGVFDIGDGVAVIVRDSMETASPNIDPSETRRKAGHPVEFDGETDINAPANTETYVFINGNFGVSNSPKVATSTSPSLPNDEHLLVGKVDTTTTPVTVTDGWFRASLDGTLRFPNLEAINDAQSLLQEGIVAYDEDRQEIRAITPSGTRVLEGITFTADADIDSTASGINIKSNDGTTQLTISDSGVEALSSLSLDGNDVATLDTSGQLKTTQLPSIAISETFTTSVEDGRLSIESDEGITIDEGDVVIETFPDLNKSYIFEGGDHTQSANWSQLGLLEDFRDPADYESGGSVELDHDSLAGRTHDGDDLTPSTVTVSEILENATYQSIDDIPNEHETTGAMAYTEEDGLVIYD